MFRLSEWSVGTGLVPPPNQPGILQIPESDATKNHPDRSVRRRRFAIDDFIPKVLAGGLAGLPVFLFLLHHPLR
jgi:hypothetical protein